MLPVPQPEQQRHAASERNTGQNPYRRLPQGDADDGTGEGRNRDWKAARAKLRSIVMIHAPPHAKGGGSVPAVSILHVRYSLVIMNKHLSTKESSLFATATAGMILEVPARAKKTYRGHHV